MFLPQKLWLDMHQELVGSSGSALSVEWRATHSCVVARPTTAPGAKKWSIRIDTKPELYFEMQPCSIIFTTEQINWINSVVCNFETTIILRAMGKQISTTGQLWCDCGRNWRTRHDTLKSQQPISLPPASWTCSQCATRPGPFQRGRGPLS